MADVVFLPARALSGTSRKSRLVPAHECGRKKGHDLCIECRAWPCHRIEGLAAGYVNLIPDSQRLKRIGTAKWLKEQEARAETGFCYVDIRPPR